MTFSKALLRDGALWREAVAGDGAIGTFLEPVTVATAGNLTIGRTAMLGGCAIFTGAAGAVNYTTPTAAQILADNPKMMDGDSFCFYLVNTAAQTATIVAGTGVTLAGFTTLNAATRLCIVKRTSSTAVTITSI